jgi:chromate transporter
MGALVGAMIIIVMRTIKDIPTALIAVGSLTALIYIKRMNEPLLMGAAALIGLFLKLGIRH